MRKKHYNFRTKTKHSCQFVISTAPWHDCGAVRNRELKTERTQIRAQQKQMVVLNLKTRNYPHDASTLLFFHKSLLKWRNNCLIIQKNYTIRTTSKFSNVPRCTEFRIWIHSIDNRFSDHYNSDTMYFRWLSTLTSYGCRRLHWLNKPLYKTLSYRISVNFNSVTNNERGLIDSNKQ